MVEEERLVLIEHALWCHGDIGGSEWFIAATADASASAPRAA